MATRIPWDKYEAAILLDACQAVIDNKFSHTDAVAMVSKTLRERAVKNGNVIDSVYRNENGISMQMNIMTALILEVPSGLHSASKLFIEIVRMYKTDQPQFKRILEEAKRGGTIVTSNKEKFYRWLEGSVRPADVSFIRKYCDLVDAYSKSNKKLGYSIFETEQLSDIQQVIRAIEKDVFFRAKNGRQIYKIEKAINEYYLFMRTGYSNAEATVAFEPKEQAVASIHSVKATVSNRDSSSLGKDDFYNYLTNDVGVAPSTGRSYVSQINTCEAYATEHSIGAGKLYHAINDSEACETAQLLMNDSVFLEFSRNAHNAPMAALRKYYEYLTRTAVKRIRTPSVVQEDFTEVEFDSYKEILLKDYRKGFRLNDRLSIRRFRMQWQRFFGEELPYDDEMICKHIAHITVQHGDMSYLPEVMLDENTKRRLLSYINSLFADGKLAIYYEALYKEFSDDFASGRINNIEMLKTYLAYINDGQMHLRRSYITADNDVEVDNTDEVRNFLISQGTAVRIDDIVSALSHIARDKIMGIIAGASSNEFVRNQKGEYFHVDIIDFSQHEMDLITEWIGYAIADKEYMGGKELTDTIQERLPSIKERYPFLTWLGLRDVLAYKLRNVFSFKGKIISAYGQDLSMGDVFTNFARTHDYFTLAQLNMLKNDLDTPIYFGSVYANSLRINKDEFVSPDQAQFDVSATDVAIDRFCHGDFISIKDVSLFGGFPNAHFPWNHFLLQHYVANYSKNYQLIHTGFNAGNPVGAIVKRSSQIDTFDDVIIRVLAESSIPLNSNDALQYLCDAGYLARRSYGNLEALLIKANLYRTNKGE